MTCFVGHDGRLYLLVPSDRVWLPTRVLSPPTLSTLPNKLPTPSHTTWSSTVFISNEIFTCNTRNKRYNDLMSAMTSSFQSVNRLGSALKVGP